MALLEGWRLNHTNGLSLFSIFALGSFVSAGAAVVSPDAAAVVLSLIHIFWKEPSYFYGGQSFRQMEGEALGNSAQNLVVTPQDAEADEIITAELENRCV